jgi:3-keto-5-aminohexanoate cleavage enzyme
MIFHNKLIVNFTPTGMIPTKDMTPHVPISANEVIEDVHRAWDAGITMTHIHARDAETERPAYQAGIYAVMIEGIRKFAPELVICVSLSGRDFQEFEKRSEVLNLDGNLKPDMGSLTLSSVNFNQQASVNEPQMIQSLARKMMERGIAPELEAFDSGMINYAHYLAHKGLIEPPYYFNLLLGNIACAQADLLHVGIMIRDLPENSRWSLAGIGNNQTIMNSVAIAMGGGVRVGIEDNIYFDQKRTKLATNLELIERVHSLAAANERELMTAKEFRAEMELLPGNGHYGCKQG